VATVANEHDFMELVGAASPAVESPDPALFSNLIGRVPKAHSPSARSG